METRVRRNTRPMRYWGTPLRRETEGLTGALHTDPHQADSIRKLRLSILGQTLWVCRAKLREKTEREAATTLAGLVIGSSADLTFPFRALLSSLYGLSAAVYTRLFLTPFPSRCPRFVPRFTNLSALSYVRSPRPGTIDPRLSPTIVESLRLSYYYSIYLVLQIRLSLRLSPTRYLSIFFFIKEFCVSSDILGDR